MYGDSLRDFVVGFVVVDPPNVVLVLRLVGICVVSLGVASCFWAVSDMKKRSDMKCSFFGRFFTTSLYTAHHYSGRVGIGGYQSISMDLADFGDFMKSPSTIMTGMPIQR